MQTPDYTKKLPNKRFEAMAQASIPIIMEYSPHMSVETALALARKTVWENELERATLLGLEIEIDDE